MQVDDPPLTTSFLHLKGLIKNEMFERHLWEKQKRFLTLEASVQISKAPCFALSTEDASQGSPKLKTSHPSVCRFFRQLLPSALSFILTQTETKYFIIKLDMSETNCKGAESTEIQTENHGITEKYEMSQVVVSKN